jgi:hypothetical protein
VVQRIGLFPDGLNARGAVSAHDCRHLRCPYERIFELTLKEDSGGMRLMM